MSRLIFLHASIKSSEHKRVREREKEEKKFCNCTWSHISANENDKNLFREIWLYGQVHKSILHGKHIGNLWFARTHKLRARCPLRPHRRQKTHLHHEFNRAVEQNGAAFEMCSHELNSNQLKLAFQGTKGAKPFLSSSQWWMQQNAEIIFLCACFDWQLILRSRFEKKGNERQKSRLYFYEKWV